MTRLEYRRRVQGLTQEELGNKILYCRNVISRLERERPGPELVNVRVRTALERYFGESFEALMQPMKPEKCTEKCGNCGCDDAA